MFREDKRGAKPKKKYGSRDATLGHRGRSRQPQGRLTRRAAIAKSELRLASATDDLYSPTPPPQSSPTKGRQGTRRTAAAGVRTKATTAQHLRDGSSAVVHSAEAVGSSVDGASSSKLEGGSVTASGARRTSRAEATAAIGSRAALRGSPRESGGGESGAGRKGTKGGRKGGTAADDFIPSGPAFSTVAGPWADTTQPDAVLVEKPLTDEDECGPSCRLSVRYRDPSVRLSLDRMSATAAEGWASIYATCGADCGSWYYEVTLGIPRVSSSSQSSERHGDETRGTTVIPCTANPSSEEVVSLPPPPDAWRKLYEVIGGMQPLDPLSDADEPSVRACEARGPSGRHVRVGWSCRYSRYDLPVGQSSFSVALCGVDGSLVHCARRYTYSNTSLRPGDTVGCYLHLEAPHSRLPDPHCLPALHSFIEAGMLCDPDHPPPNVPNLGSYVEFSVNGKRQGKAPMPYLYSGVYHPAMSLFNGAVATANFGPNFRYMESSLNNNCKTLRANEGEHADHGKPSLVLPARKWKKRRRLAIDEGDDDKRNGSTVAAKESIAMAIDGRDVCSDEYGATIGFRPAAEMPRLRIK